MTLDEIAKRFKQHEVDFIIPKKKGDTPIFIDLYLLYESPDQRWHKAQALIYQYFNHYLNLYRAKKISSEKLIERLNFPEVKEIALGHCKKGVEGRGSAHERAENIKKTIFDDPAVQEIGMDAITKMSVEIANVGPDVLSDMVAAFAMPYLLEYTDEQVKTFGLKTAEYQIRRILDSETQTWKPLLKIQLPYLKTTGEPRILVPKHLVKRFPIISAVGFFNNYLRHILRQEMDDRDSTIRSIGKLPKVSFKVVSEELKKKYGKVGIAIKRIAEERSDLISKYIRNPRVFEKQNRRRKLKEGINWDSYVAELDNIDPGKKDAKKFAEYLRKIFSTIYGNSLLNGKLEEQSEDDLFFYDITFANNANTPLFGIIRNQGIKAGVVILEAKNYKETDLGNKEFNQSRSYTISNGRELVLLAARKEITNKDIERARRHFLAQRCIILPISDSDIKQLIEARRNDQNNFDVFLVDRLQKILSA